MPKNRGFYGYVSDFSDVLLNKYGRNSITPSIYQKEILKFLKTINGGALLNDISKFINETSLKVVNSEDDLAKDKKLMPYEYQEGLVEKNIVSSKVYEAIGSSISKDDYVDFCNSIPGEEIKGTKNAEIEYKVNKFKIVEALKPKGNAFTTFFKKLFNIGGYNDKIAAYQSCKQSIRELVGDKLTNEQFEESIRSDKRFSLANYQEKEIEKPLNINELDEQVKDVKLEKSENVETLEKVNELNI